MRRSLPADFTYGSKPALRSDATQAGELLSCEGSLNPPREPGVDVGLGKSIQEGWKNSEVPDRVRVGSETAVSAAQQRQALVSSVRTAHHNCTNGMTAFGLQIVSSIWLSGWTSW